MTHTDNVEWEVMNVDVHVNLHAVISGIDRKQ